MRLYGYEAIYYADNNGHFLCTDTRDDITIPEARRIEDDTPGTVFIDEWED